MKSNYVNIGNHRIEITQYDDNSISIKDPQGESGNQGFSFEESSTQKDDVKSKLSEMIDNAKSEEQQKGIDFIDNL